MKIESLKDAIVYFNEKNIIEYLSLLHTLSNVYDSDDELKYMIDNFKKQILKFPSNVNIFVILVDNIVVGSGSIIIEQKIIHGFSKVGHIEDIVIDKNYQGKGYGKKIIDYLINFARENNCYKITLGCNDNKVNFYKICQPKKSKLKVINQISYYLDI